MNAPQDSSAPLIVAEAGISIGSLQHLSPAARFVPPADLEAAAAAEASARDVICITKDRDIAMRVSHRAGVIPVWLDDHARSNVLSDPSVVTIHDTSKLAAYFDDAAAPPILGLARWRPSDTRTQLFDRLSYLLEAAGVAGGITVYGAGTIGRQAINAARLIGLPVKAILDANAELHGTKIDGIEVRPLSSVTKGTDVVVPALGRHIVAITNALHEHGVHSVMSLSELYYISRRPGEPETDYLDDLFANRHRYHSLFLALADLRSREVLSAVLEHRLSLATNHLSKVAERSHAQWFDPAFLPRTESDVFVDGGAFDGDTVLGYVEARGPDYKHIHAFEIDPDVSARAVSRTAHLTNVTIHSCGLSDREALASYRKTGGTDGAIGHHAGNSRRVALRTIDTAVHERITFLKLDVEGEEAKTIDGARHHLKNDRPALAVALYHKAHDMWDIPRRILDLLPDYRLHLRHYTDTAYETIVYAIRGQ